MHGILKSRCNKVESYNAAPILAAAVDDDFKVLSMRQKKNV